MNGTTSDHEESIPLPSAKPSKVSSSVTTHAPLTRRGHGPGLILLVPSGLDLNGSDKTLDPPPLQKWAEEGYAVAQITLSESEGDKFKSNLQEALDALSKLKECDSVEKVGLICKLAKAMLRDNALTITLSVQRACDSRCGQCRWFNEVYCWVNHLWQQQSSQLETATLSSDWVSIENCWRTSGLESL